MPEYLNDRQWHEQQGYRLYPSPNDSARDGTIHEIAIRQLIPYQELAKTWGTYKDERANRCKLCDQSIWFGVDPYGEPYSYTEEDIMSLIVAHIRQVHPNIQASLQCPLLASIAVRTRKYCSNAVFEKSF